VNKERAIAALTSHADEIRAFGVSHVFIFGSTARDEARRGSDVDLFFDLRRGARFSLFDLMDLRAYLRKILGTKADAIPRNGLHRAIRRDVLREAVRVF
jgi:uncharacterized protein